jgi:hypothetical protein
MPGVLRLVRLSAPYRATGWLAGLLFLAGLAASRVEVGPWTLAALTPVLMAIVVSVTPQRRCELWLVALPIHGRTLLMARTISWAVMVWVPWICAVAGLALGGEHLIYSARKMAIAPTFVTLFLAVLNAGRTQEMEPTSSMLASVLAPAGVLLIILGTAFWGVPFQLGVVAIALGLLVYGIGKAPATFQLTVAPVTQAPTPVGTATLTSSDWTTRNLPFLRPMLGWQPVAAYLFAFTQIFFVRNGFSPLAVSSLSFYPRAMLESTFWMYGLPVHRRRILAWSILPCWMLFSACSAFGVWLGPLYPLDKLIPDDRYWVADYLLSQFWFAVTAFCPLYVMKRPPLKGRKLWRVLATSVINILPFFLVMFPTYDAPNGPPLHVQLTLALARHLPTEPVFWIVMIAGTSVALWILLLRAFRNIDITFDTPRSAT